MDSVQKFILSIVLFLLFSTIGTQNTYAQAASQDASVSLYAQQELPVERTLNFLYTNGNANLPQSVSINEPTTFSLTKLLFCTYSNANHLYDITSIPYIFGAGFLHHGITSGIEYYIYALRKIII